MSIDEICPSNGVVREFLQDLVKFELGTYQWQYEDGTDATKDRKALVNQLRSFKKSDKSEETEAKRQVII